MALEISPSLLLAFTQAFGRFGHVSGWHYMGNNYAYIFMPDYRQAFIAVDELNGRRMDWLSGNYLSALISHQPELRLMNYTPRSAAAGGGE